MNLNIEYGVVLISPGVSTSQRTPENSMTDSAVTDSQGRVVKLAEVHSEQHNCWGMAVYHAEMSRNNLCCYEVAGRLQRRQQPQLLKQLSCHHVTESGRPALSTNLIWSMQGAGFPAACHNLQPYLIALPGWGYLDINNWSSENTLTYPVQLSSLLYSGDQG